MNIDTIEKLIGLTDSAATAIILADLAGRQAATLCATMRALHGGEWRVQVDHDAEFVSIRRSRRPGP